MERTELWGPWGIIFNERRNQYLLMTYYMLGMVRLLIYLLIFTITL